jgi:hypothetical protein
VLFTRRKFMFPQVSQVGHPSAGISCKSIVVIYSYSSVLVSLNIAGGSYSVPTAQSGGITYIFQLL